MTPAQERIQRWRRDPISFVRDVFGIEPDAWQLEALAECGKDGRKRIAMPACAGPGKTALLAWIGWHRLICFAKPGEHPKGLAISCDGENLAMNLWPELAKWQGRSPLLLEAFQWQKTLIFAKDHPETWFLSARAFARAADPETAGRALSGLHSQFPFYLIDESGDMPESILRSAEQGLATCEDGLIITSGNTTSTTGLLYAVCSRLRAEWKVIKITGDPDDPLRSPRVDIDWARKQIELYGRDNDWVKAYVLGMFPDGGLNSILTVAEVEAAMGRHVNADSYSWAQKRLGIDVARFGDDRTVLFPRQGCAAFMPTVMRMQDTCAIAARAVQAKADFNAEMTFVDDSGHWGHGVIDNLRAYGQAPIAVLFESKPNNERYFNRRTEMWMEMAKWIKNGGCLPNIPELIGELTAPTYTFANGRFVLESKDQIKKRLKKSPDLGDALCLTFALPDMPANTVGNLLHGMAMRRKQNEDWDPFAPKS